MINLPNRCQRLISRAEWHTVRLKGASGESEGLRRYDKENLLWQSTVAIRSDPVGSLLVLRSRWWRVVCIAMTLVFFIAPVGMNLLYSWELARYIAVMGITSKRIEGALLSVLFMFVPMACLAECFIGVKSAKRIIYAAFWCMLAAGIVFMAVNAAACKSISCHPLPTNIYP